MATLEPTQPDFPRLLDMVSEGEAVLIRTRWASHPHA